MTHILIALYGDQDSQAALLRLDDAAAASIRAARETVRQFATQHGGTPSINHIGPYHIHFLSGIPAGFVPGFDDPDDMSALYDIDPPILTDLDEDAFTDAAENLNFYQRSECTGLKIYQDQIYIVGSEKNVAGRIESYELSFPILLTLDPHAKWETSTADEEEDKEDDDDMECTQCYNGTCAWCEAEKKAFGKPV